MAIVLAPFVFIVAMDGWVDSLSARESVGQVQHARMIASDVSDPNELPSAGWLEVSLPNRYTSAGAAPTSVWYRLEVNVAESTDASWAIYLARPDANFAAFVNGRFVGESGPMTSPVPLYVTPLLLPFPGALLHPGRNYADVRSVRASKWSGLQSIQIAPKSRLAPVFNASYLFKSTIKQVTVVCMLAISVMMAALFRLRSRDSAFGWFAIALLCWAIHISMPLIPRLPFEDPFTRTNLSQLFLGAYIVVAAFFVHRFVDVKYVWRERCFALWFLIGVVAVMLTPVLPGYPLRWFMGLIWYPPVACIGMYVTWPLWLAYKKGGVLGAGLLTSVSWFLFIVGALDQLVGAGLIRWRPNYHPYTAGLVLIAFGFILLKRFVHAVDIAEHARDELEVRVVEKTMALERNLVRIKDMEREQALTVERERIMRDMHDGVGGQLVQALSMATGQPELQPLEEPLRTCLEELRLIVDSIEPTDGNLVNVLGSLRTRMSRRLTAADVQVHWQVADAPMLTNFGPHRVLQVTRIVQEAVANALKHARAKHVTVSARAIAESIHSDEPSTIVLEISDDGIGIAAQTNGGHGLCNMRRRAEDLAAQLTIDTSSSGTTVRVSLPLAENINDVENRTVTIAHK